MCATKVASHTQGAGLSDNKRSVHAMKVDPRENKFELADDKDLASKDVKHYYQVYGTSPKNTNFKRKWEEETWMESSWRPGGSTRWPSSRISREIGTQTSGPGSVSSDLRTSELHKKQWSKLCLYPDRGDDEEQGQHGGGDGAGDEHVQDQAVVKALTAADEQHEGAGSGGDGG